MRFFFFPVLLCDERYSGYSLAAWAELRKVDSKQCAKMTENCFGCCRLANLVMI